MSFGVLFLCICTLKLPAQKVSKYDVINESTLNCRAAFAHYNSLYIVFGNLNLLFRKYEDRYIVQAYQVSKSSREQLTFILSNGDTLSLNDSSSRNYRKYEIDSLSLRRMADNPPHCYSC